MAKRVNVFYAFPNDPQSIKESINDAINELKGHKDVRSKNVRFRPWPTMHIGGKQIINTITQHIERSRVFACDLTYPNFNVTFELGYAIGKFNRIWISLNTAVEKAPNEYKRIYYNLLGGLGYEGYTNHKNLAKGMVDSAPWRDLDTTPLGEIYRSTAAMEELPTLLYIKPSIDTDAVIGTSEVLGSSIFAESLIIDDPRENPSPTLEWYAGKIRIADAVIVQLLAEDQRDSANHNLKCSFAAGLAYAFRKPLLIVAPTPYDPPVDYQTLLKVHDTAQQCRNFIDDWVTSLASNIPKRRPRRPTEATHAGKAPDLRRLSVGEPVAEHERRKLDDYFVETSAYFHALDGPATILVGRRGTGKTATLYALKSTLGKDKRNHVCIIKPVGYEIDGVVRILNENLHGAERGYLIESLWKFLIFTELAKSAFEEISSRPIYTRPTENEEKFLEFVNNNSDTISAPFSERLDRAVRDLTGIGDLADASAQKVRISERLHSGKLRDLRELTGLVLTNRRNVAILIDNLDEQWGPGQDIKRLTELLMGLLRVTQDICDEFQQEDHWRKPVSVSVTVLLRSDIFAFIQPLAAEQDKLPIQRIFWDDPELLINVVNQRFEHASSIGIDAETIWRQFFPDEVVGVPTIEFITRTVLPRPRDIIYLVREAIDGAVNRGHSTVQVSDLLDARNKYSEFVFRSILAEDDPRKGKLEAVLFEFAGAPKILKLSDVCLRISRAEVDQADIDFYIDLLCDVNFLGIQSAQGFRYSKHEGERQMLRQVSKRLAVDRSWGEESYEVNFAFHWVLQIE